MGSHYSRFLKKGKKYVILRCRFLVILGLDPRTHPKYTAPMALLMAPRFRGDDNVFELPLAQRAAAGFIGLFEEGFGFHGAGIGRSFRVRAGFRDCVRRKNDSLRAHAFAL